VRGLPQLPRVQGNKKEEEEEEEEEEKARGILKSYRRWALASCLVSIVVLYVVYALN